MYYSYTYLYNEQYTGIMNSSLYRYRYNEPPQCEPTHIMNRGGGAQKFIIQVLSLYLSHCKRIKDQRTRISTVQWHIRISLCVRFQGLKTTDFSRKYW